MRTEIYIKDALEKLAKATHEGATRVPRFSKREYLIFEPTKSFIQSERGYTAYNAGSVKFLKV